MIDAVAKRSGIGMQFFTPELYTAINSDDAAAARKARAGTSLGSTSGSTG